MLMLPSSAGPLLTVAYRTSAGQSYLPLGSPYVWRVFLHHQLKVIIGLLDGAFLLLRVMLAFLVGIFQPVQWPATLKWHVQST